jgi:hypothetical protein
MCRKTRRKMDLHLDSRRIDMVRLGLMVCLVAYFTADANAQTFGLGVSSKNNVTVSTFGLSAASVATLQKVVRPTPPPALSQVVQQTPVVRRASSYWTEGGRAWNSQTIHSHLLKHNVPSSELVGRSLKEMIDIHDNIHEGYGWNGSVKARVQPVSNCPGGVCPAPTRFTPRRFFRR